MDELLLFITLIGIFLGIVVLIILSLKKQSNVTSDQTLIHWLKTMQGSLDQGNKNVSDTLAKSTAVLNQRLDSTIGIVAQATQEITRMNELGKSIRDLQLLLQSPKLRGSLGEEVLENMLEEVFPKGQFALQYNFKSGNKVDAMIKTTAGNLCIDAKFPLENFQKKVKAENTADRDSFSKLFTADVKKHIKDIATKYIVPEENTVDFAFMYIPSETVFYEIATTLELLEFSKANRVYPVSPNTLYLHLQTILLSFEGQRIESKAKQVMNLLKALQKDYGKLDENLQVLGRHLHNASNQFSNTQQQATFIGQRLSQRELLEEGSQ